MRKILLATAAGFAAVVANGIAPAQAQTGPEVSGQTPQPGLTTYVQGRYRFYMGLVDQDGDSGNTAGAGNNAGNSMSSVDFFDYGRIWVGADGVAANGLRYGARLEIRMPTGGGARGDGRGSLQYRRMLGYVGTPTLGQLRFGSGQVTAVEQMTVGHIMGSIGTGLLDGDANVVAGGTVASSFFYSSSAINNRTAIGYYTPQFFGFDAGISYSPNDGNFNGNCTPGATDASFDTCDRLDSSTTQAGAARLRNQIDGMVRYRGTFGAIGLAASGGFRTADAVDFNGAPAANAAPFKRATAGLVGATVTWAGLTVGALTTFGPYNRGFTALPENGNNDSAFSYQLGANYRFGAFTIGAAYHYLETEGSAAVAGDQKDKGWGIGGTYAVAPGMTLYAEYVNSSVEESGRDLNAVEAGVQDKFDAQAFILGVGFAW